MSKHFSIEFTLGLVVAIVLYILDKSGKSSVVLNIFLLIVIFGLLLHPALQISWIWSPDGVTVRLGRIVLVICVILVCVGWFGIWTWPTQSEQANIAKSKISTPNPLSAVPSPAQAPSAPAISGPPLSIPPSETVDGKQILSARRLRDLFPFGYYVFSKKEGQWTYEATPEANRLQYHIDPKRVQIEPDFAKKTVHWKILLSAEAPNGQAFALQDNLVELTVPMTTRRGQSGEIVHPVFLLPFFYQENQPSPFVVTLDDDQRFPVFTLGFRIPDKESTQLSPTPNTAASPP